MSAPQDFRSMLSGQHAQYQNAHTSQNVMAGSSQQPGMQELTMNGTGPSSLAAPVPPRPTQEISAPTICRLGQETVQEIISRIQEIFQTLRTLQPPNGSINGASIANDKKTRILETLRYVQALMKKLRIIYDKCCDLTKHLDMGYTHVETLIPLEEEWDGKSDERKNAEVYRQEVAERDALREQVAASNQEIKDALDLLRRSVWEINAMLDMALRRS